MPARRSRGFTSSRRAGPRRITRPGDDPRQRECHGGTCVPMQLRGPNLDEARLRSGQVAPIDIAGRSEHCHRRPLNRRTGVGDRALQALAGPVAGPGQQLLGDEREPIGFGFGGGPSREAQQPKSVSGTASGGRRNQGEYIECQHPCRRCVPDRCDAATSPSLDENPRDRGRAKPDDGTADDHEPHSVHECARARRRGRNHQSGTAEPAPADAESETRYVEGRPAPDCTDAHAARPPNERVPQFVGQDAEQQRHESRRNEERTADGEQQEHDQREARHSHTVDGFRPDGRGSCSGLYSAICESVCRAIRHGRALTGGAPPSGPHRAVIRYAPQEPRVERGFFVHEHSREGAR